MLAIVGQALIITAVASALLRTDHAFLLTAGADTRLMAASTLARVVGAVLGAGPGSVVRNLHGAVGGAMLDLFVLPPWPSSCSPRRRPGFCKGASP